MSTSFRHEMEGGGSRPKNSDFCNFFRGLFTILPVFVCHQITLLTTFFSSHVTHLPWGGVVVPPHFGAPPGHSDSEGPAQLRIPPRAGTGDGGLSRPASPVTGRINKMLVVVARPARGAVGRGRSCRAQHAPGMARPLQQNRAFCCPPRSGARGARFCRFAGLPALSPPWSPVRRFLRAGLCVRAGGSVCPLCTPGVPPFRTQALSAD